MTPPTEPTGLREAADYACRALDAAIGAAECGYVPSKSVQAAGREAATNLRAALASPEPTGDVDAERLARALATWWLPISEHLSTAGTYSVSFDPAAAAEAIATEYARLAASEGQGEASDDHS